MKSIIQEASSVMKAIEKGWENAGKPKEFSIKIFEEPKKNFIGMTIQSAKVGIFFDEKLTLAKEPEKEKIFIAKKTEQIQKPVPKKEAVLKSEKTAPKESGKAPQRVTPVKAEQKETPKEQKIVWTPEMVDFATRWVSEILKTMNISAVDFTTQTSRYQLLIQFNKPLLHDEEKEQQLMRSFSLLLIQTLRHALKRPLRGFKIILTRKS